MILHREKRPSNLFSFFILLEILLHLLFLHISSTLSFPVSTLISSNVSNKKINTESGRFGKISPAKKETYAGSMFHFPLPWSIFAFFIKV
jgi:hypothetical protein